MRFKVPQFIDIEDKIFGPLTFKQFMYMGGGLGLTYVTYRFLPLYGALPIMAAILALSFSLTFVEINKKPFIYILEAYIRYIIGSKMYLWKKVSKREATGAVSKSVQKEKVETPKLTEGRLKSLSLGLNIIEEN